MSKFTDFAKSFDIRSNAAWDFIKWVLGGGTLITAFYSAVLRLLTSIPFDWVIIFALFITSLVVISVIHLFQKNRNAKDLVQDEAVNSIVEKNEKTSESIANSFAVYDIDAHLIQVKDKVFINEKVLLDGHSYRYCKFTNVKFVYNGTAPSEITNSVFEGRIIATENPAVDSTICILRGLGFIKEEIAIFPADGKPLAHINPPQNLESENK